MNELNKKKSKKDKVVEHNVYYIPTNPSLPPAFIIDIDGTIALITGRSPFDETKWYLDIPHQPIIDLIYYLWVGMEIEGNRPSLLFMTGRNGGKENREKIRIWLERYTPFISDDEENDNFILFTRTPGDHRGDVEVKHELYEKYVVGYYDVKYVFEDRNKMVKFWRNEIGLPTLQVKDGDY